LNGATPGAAPPLTHLQPRGENIDYGFVLGTGAAIRADPESSISINADGQLTGARPASSAHGRPITLSGDTGAIAVHQHAVRLLDAQQVGLVGFRQSPGMSPAQTLIDPAVAPVFADQQ